MSKFVVDNQEIKKGLGEAVINAISDVFDYTKEKNNVIKQKYASFQETLKNLGFDTLQNIVDACLNKQAHFHHVYT